MTPIYTGIGSRVAPQHALRRATRLAGVFLGLGWRLRSGGALGMDQAWEAGAGGRKEIYYPRGDLTDAMRLFDAEVRPLAKTCSIFKMRPKIAALLARNMYQVLGAGLDTPPHVVLCWTPIDDYHSRVAGGTRYACLLAEARGVPIINLASCGLSDAEILARVEALR